MYDFFAFSVERRCGFIQNKNRRIFQNSPCNTKTLPLPSGKLNHATADVLVLLPPGYPDVAPDMFYCDPWLTLQSVGRYPTCADQAHAFQGRSWQRWSRHNTAWRPGIDGLHTMLKRIEHALTEAK